MSEQLRQFIASLSREEKIEVIQVLVPELAQGLEEERPMIDLDGVVVGYFVPFAKWLESQPPKTPPIYKNEEEAYEAAKNGRSPSEIVAWFNAMYPAEADQSVVK